MAVETEDKTNPSKKNYKKHTKIKKKTSGTSHTKLKSVNTLQKKKFDKKNGPKRLYKTLWKRKRNCVYVRNHNKMAKKHV